MGHSILTISRKGILNNTEVSSIVANKKNDDEFEYGHGENADSWVHADYPRGENLSIVYSESAAMDIVNSIDSYGSMYLYYVPDNVWKSHFLSNESKIEKIKTKLNKIKSELKDFSDDAFNKSDVKLWLNQKNNTESVFITCTDCKSKIHAPSYLWANKKIPERCPVCRSDNPNLSNEWREALYGKRYTAKRANLTEEIEKMQLDITQLESCDIKEISVYELDKKGNEDLKIAVTTLIAADIHH